MKCVTMYITVSVPQTFVSGAGERFAFKFKNQHMDVRNGAQFLCYSAFNQRAWLKIPNL